MVACPEIMFYNGQSFVLPKTILRMSGKEGVGIKKALELFVYTMINRKQYKLMPIYYLISTNAVYCIQYNYKT